ncbi:hypothetical protein [Actinoplanes sp. G11-F43]|uniref:hypothetical protein n=1 Tax=Actinoplanes sp. G11-F43 TaxID=3424130 RepID=UPI003D35917C
MSSGVTVLKGDLGRSPLEEAIAASGLAWTGLAPVEFMSNTLEWAASIRAEGVVRAGFAGMPSTLVHDGDIAAVAAVALTENKSNKQRTEQGGGSGSEAAGGSGAGKGCGSGAGEGGGSGSEEGGGSGSEEAGGSGSEQGGGSGSEEAGGGRGSGREYWLTGPEALTPPEQVAIIAAVLGREVRFVELSRDEVVAGWRADGYGPEDIEFFLAMRTDPPAAGYTVLPTVEDVLGRPARTLRTWVAENRSAFD